MQCEKSFWRAVDYRMEGRIRQKKFNCITNVSNNLTEGGRGKEAGLSNFGSEWSS